MNGWARVSKLGHSAQDTYTVCFSPQTQASPDDRSHAPDNAEAGPGRESSGLVGLGFKFGLWPNLSPHFQPSLICLGSFGDPLCSGSHAHSPQHVPWEGKWDKRGVSLPPHWAALAQAQRAAELNAHVRMPMMPVTAGWQQEFRRSPPVKQQLSSLSPRTAAGWEKFRGSLDAALLTRPSTSQSDCGSEFYLSSWAMRRLGTILRVSVKVLNHHH